MREHFLTGESEWVWRMLLQGRDHLAAILADGDQALVDSWEAKPGNAGTAEWSALLAALTAHTFENTEAEPPPWAQTTPLERPWIPIAASADSLGLPHAKAHVRAF